MDKNKKIIGRLEYIDLPDFDMSGIVAKIDTGAYNGAIHATNIVEDEEGGLTFNILDPDHPEFKDNVYKADDYIKKPVKTSRGFSEDRYFIPVTVVISGEVIKARLSLSNRKDMRYPVLIGRKVIKNHFIVDVSKKFTN